MTTKGSQAISPLRRRQRHITVLRAVSMFCFSYLSVGLLKVCFVSTGMPTIAAYALSVIIPAAVMMAWLSPQSWAGRKLHAPGSVIGRRVDSHPKQIGVTVALLLLAWFWTTIIVWRL